jgi:hypothetical protein
LESFLTNFPGIPTQIAIILVFVVAYFLKKTINRLNKKAVKKRENSLQPCISLFRDGAAGQFYPKNIGHGPAFNISFDPIEAGPYKYVFPKYDFLGSGDSSRAFNVIKMRNDSSFDICAEQIDPFEISDDFTLKISYSNIEKMRCESVLRVTRANQAIELIRSGYIR